MSAQGIKASEFWQADDYSEHSKLFKLILKEYGLKTMLKKHQFQNAFSQEAFAEALFTVVFAPSCPVIFDPTGHLLEFLQETVFKEMPSKLIYASDSLVNSQVEQTLRSQ